MSVCLHLSNRYLNSLKKSVFQIDIKLNLNIKSVLAFLIINLNKYLFLFYFYVALYVYCVSIDNFNRLKQPFLVYACSSKINIFILRI